MAAAPRPDRALDPAVVALLTDRQERGEPPMFAGSVDGRVDEDRMRFADDLRATARSTPRVPEVVDGPVPVAMRLHRPAARPSDATVIFVHGGGWALGGGAAYDPVAARLAEDTGALVVAIDYRLAPEHPFPAAYDDVVAAVRWVREHVAADPERCAVVGDSAGANLALGAALVLRDDGSRLVGQLLVYPPADFEARYPSLVENGEGYWLTAADVRTCSRLYLAGHDPRGDQRLSPMRASLDGLGPTVVATAGYDPLRDVGSALARALTEAGVDARLREHPHLIHGFLGFTAVVPAADAAVAALNAELAALLA